jgi:hypothetical protein
MRRIKLPKNMDVTMDDIKRAVGTDMSSDEEDPHGWKFDCEVVQSTGLLKAWWVCRRCKSVVRVRSSIMDGGGRTNAAYDVMAALSRLAVATNVERRKVHPRCSEAKVLQEVMES